MINAILEFITQVHILDISVSTFLYYSFIHFCTHTINMHFLTFIQIFVNILYVVSKREDYLFVYSVHLISTRKLLHNAHSMSEHDNISSKDPHQHSKFVFPTTKQNRGNVLPIHGFGHMDLNHLWSLYISNARSSAIDCKSQFQWFSKEQRIATPYKPWRTFSKRHCIFILYFKFNCQV